MPSTTTTHKENKGGEGGRHTMSKKEEHVGGEPWEFLGGWRRSWRRAGKRVRRETTERKRGMGFYWKGKKDPAQRSWQWCRHASQSHTAAHLLRRDVWQSKGTCIVQGTPRKSEMVPGERKVVREKKKTLEGLCRGARALVSHIGTLSLHFFGSKNHTWLSARGPDTLVLSHFRQFLGLFWQNVLWHHNTHMRWILKCGDGS